MFVFKSKGNDKCFGKEGHEISEHQLSENCINSNKTVELEMCMMTNNTPQMGLIKVCYNEAECLAVH